MEDLPFALKPVAMSETQAVMQQRASKGGTKPRAAIKIFQRVRRHRRLFEERMGRTFTLGVGASLYPFTELDCISFCIADARQSSVLL